MKRYLFLGLVLSTHIGIAVAQTPAPEPTSFESFATKPNTVVLFTKEVGSLDSSDAKVTVTALSVEDTATPVNAMRGVRFDLENNVGLNRVYLSKSQLELLLQELALLERGISRQIKENRALYSIQGTASCWMPDPALRILCPGYRINPRWSGFTLAAFGGCTFALPGHAPSALSKLIELAIIDLEAN